MNVSTVEASREFRCFDRNDVAKENVLSRIDVVDGLTLEHLTQTWYVSTWRDWYLKGVDRKVQLIDLKNVVLMTDSELHFL